MGDFVGEAPDLEIADLVVMDRVICCDPRLDLLVEAAASRTGRLLAVSYPRDRILVSAVIGVQNLVRRLRGEAFRVWVHPVEAIHRAMAGHGLALRAVRHTFVWEMAVFERP